MGRMLDRDDSSISPLARGKSMINPAMAYLGSLHSASSKRNMTWQLNAIARFFGAPSLTDLRWDRIDESDLLRYRAALQTQGASAAKVHNLFAALRGVAKQAWKLGLITAEQRMRWMSVQESGTEPHRVGKALSLQESKKLIAVCLGDTSPMGARDAAMIALCLGAGLRRSEIVGARLPDLNLTARTLLVRGTGNKVREVWFSSTTEQYIKDWIACRGWLGGPGIFCAVIKNTVRTDWMLKPNSFTRAVMKRGAQAGIILTPHDLRRTFATRLLDAGADLDTVREAMGHASVTTTQKYDKRPRNRIKKFAQEIAL